MKKTYLWMSAAILCSSLMMTSCADQNDDPVTPAEDESVSAIDPGKWWIDESNMDKSVKPSDNFYMYCNGTWWKNTTIPPTTNPFEFIVRRELPKPTFEEQVSSAIDVDANYGKFKSHLKWAEPYSAAAASAQELYDNALKQSGLETATTREDALRAFGKMSTLGVTPFFGMDPFCLDGKICLCAYFEDVVFEEEVNASNNASRSAGRPSFLQMVNEHPELQTHLVPISGASATRGTVSSEWSFATYILEGMGIDAQYVFVIDDLLKTQGTFSENSDIVKFQEWQKAFDDNDVKKLKEKLLTYYSTDYCLISRKTMEESNQTLVDKYNEGKNNGAKLTQLSLDKIEKTLTEGYLGYLRSKIVADKLVPAGLKEEYLKHCEEIKAVFAQRIRDNEWMSDGSKQNALDKLNAMAFNIGYPDRWYQEGLPDFSKSESLLEDVYIMRKARLELLKKIAGKSRTQESFTAMCMHGTRNLTFRNGVYEPVYNCMNMFPYYILPPFYDPTQSLAINYEGFCTLGHEITHGFDNTTSCTAHPICFLTYNNRNRTGTFCYCKLLSAFGL